MFILIKISRALLPYINHAPARERLPLSRVLLTHTNEGAKRLTLVLDITLGCTKRTAPTLHQSVYFSHYYYVNHFMPICVKN